MVICHYIINLSFVYEDMTSERFSFFLRYGVTPHAWMLLFDTIKMRRKLI